MLFRRMPAFTRIEHGTGVHRLRRECRAHADFPALLLRGNGFAGQRQAVYLRDDFTLAVTFQRPHRNKQRRAFTRGQRNRLRLGPFQRQITASSQGDVQGLRTIGEVSQIQRQPGAIAAGQEARCV